MQLPKDFVERTKAILMEEWDDFYQSLQTLPPTSIRVNRKKYFKKITLEKVRWCDSAYYLEQRPQFTFDPLLHAGAYYVQEASSMIIEQAMRQLISGDIRALDLCAAPGGKSTLISSLLTKSSLLLSNEIIRSRANILAENMMKWGNPNIIVTNNKPGDYSDLTSYFDLLLVDAPCSGEGMFRKDEQSIEEWSVSNVELCARRQREIISAVWDTIKPGGYLFYSTCTYNREENEEIVDWICNTYDANVVALELDDSWQVVPSLVNNKPTYHFFPHKTKGEGLYFAVIQKGEEESLKPFSIKQKDKRKNSSSKVNLSDYERFIYEEDNLTLYEESDTIKAFPTKYFEDLSILKNKLSVIHSGISMGERKGKSFIPHQSLALSNSLNKNSFSVVDIEWEAAISYLRKETILLEDAPKDIVLLTYRNIPLGFVKNIGNRANNLYPNEWRIRSTNLPQQQVDILE